MTFHRPALLLAAVAVLVAPAAEARGHKKPKKPKPPVGMKVRIESQPPGATVYLGDKDSAPVGTTPVDLTMPIGEATVILELEGYVDRFETVDVQDSDLSQTFAYEMTPATATLVVEPAAGTHLPKGAHVTVDGVDKGEVPQTLQVEVGAHEVVVTAPGRDPYDQWVQVDGGSQSQTIDISPDQLHGGDLTAATPGVKHRRDIPFGELSVGVDIGWRSFHYDSPRTTNLLPYDGKGNPEMIVDAELYPWRRFVANRLLDHLSITAGAGYAPAIRASNDAGMTIDAYWRSQHAGLRFHAGPRRIGADVEAGWAHVLYTFRDPQNRLVDEVPDVDYQMIVLGARAISRLGPHDMVDLWLGADNRIVLKSGVLGTRFRGAKVSGYSARLGGAAWFWKRRLQARAEAYYQHMGWTFESMTGDAYDADGGTDSLYGLTLSVGGSY